MSDPRDMIWGHLGIFGRGVPPKSFNIAMGKVNEVSTCDLYNNFALYLLKLGIHEVLLCREDVALDSRRHGLASWAPDCECGADEGSFNEISSNGRLLTMKGTLPYTAAPVNAIEHHEISVILPYVTVQLSGNIESPILLVLAGIVETSIEAILELKLPILWPSLMRLKPLMSVWDVEQEAELLENLLVFNQAYQDEDHWRYYNVALLQDLRIALVPKSAQVGDVIYHLRPSSEPAATVLKVLRKLPPTELKLYSKTQSRVVTDITSHIVRLCRREASNWSGPYIRYKLKLALDRPKLCHLQFIGNCLSDRRYEEHLGEEKPLLLILH